MALKPYTAFGWSAPVGSCPRIYPAVRIIDGVDIAITSVNTSHVAAALNAQPPGARVMILTDNSFNGWPKNAASLATDGITYGPWPSPAFMLSNCPTFFNALLAADVTIDMIACDVENVYGTYGNSSAGYAAIEADPHGPVIEAAVGFADLVANLDTSSGYRPNHVQKMAYDNYCASVLGAAANTGLLATLKNAYPDALLNNYAKSYIPQTIPQPDANGYMNYFTGTLFGNTQAPECYADASDTSDISISLGLTIDWTDPASTITYTLNRARAGSASPAPIIPWVQQRSFSAGTIGNTIYWDEMVRHLLITGSGNLLYFNSAPVDDTTLDTLMNETATIAVNSVPVQLLTNTQLPYSNTGYSTIVTAARLQNGSILGRVTFFGGTTSATVSIAGLSVEVAKPGGSIGAWFLIPPLPLPNVVYAGTGTMVPLAQAVVSPFLREGCAVRGVMVQCLDGSGNLVTSTGYRLGTKQLLTVNGSGHYVAAVRDGNGCWSEWSSNTAITVSNFVQGSIEASIGSGATTDADISSPGIVFPDLAFGSARMSVHRTLVVDGFLDSTQSSQWPKPRAAFMVKLDNLDADDRTLVHRFWRGLGGPARPFFFDYVEPSDGGRTTGVSRRYTVRFRDQKVSDSLFGGSFTEAQFALIELQECPSGGDTYSPQFSTFGINNPNSYVAGPNYIDTEFQFEPRAEIELSPKWRLADTPAGGIMVGFVPYPSDAAGTLVNTVLYRLNDDTGTVALDWSGNGYNGTYVGATLGGSAAVNGDPSPTFSGTGDSCVQGNSALTGYPNGRSALTFTCWFRHSGQIAPAQIMGWYGTKRCQIFIDIEGGSSYVLRAIVSYNSTSVETVLTSQLGDGDWHFAAVIFDAPNLRWVFVVDGVNEGYVTLPGGATMTSGSDPFFIASRADSQWQFAGQVSQGIVYPSALTVAQIQALYANGRSGAETALGLPTSLYSAWIGPNRALYAINSNRMNQRAAITFVPGPSFSTVQSGVVLRYKDTSNYILAYATGDGHFAVTERVAGTSTNLVVISVTLAAICSLQAEVIGTRLRWWFEPNPEVQDRPPDGAVDLGGAYDDSFNGWGIFLQSLGQPITRFIACELPGAIMPAPALSVAAAPACNFYPITLNFTTTYPDTGQNIEWEVLPDDPADFPEPYRAITPATSTSHVIFVRGGYSYQARARVTQTPWSEYAPVSAGSLGGTDWTSRPQLLTNWPTEDFATAGQTVPPVADYTFPAIIPDYVLEGVDEIPARISTANMGRDSSSITYRRPRRTFTLKFENRTSGEYQVAIDFFEFCSGKRTPFNWTHPITAEQFVLGFNSDDYERTDKDQSSEEVSAIASISFACIEIPPDGFVVPTLSFDLEMDPTLIPDESETLGLSKARIATHLSAGDVSI